MKLEGLAHLSAIEHALQLESNVSSWQFNQTALEELNDVMFVVLAPAIAVLVIAMVIGVLGNVTVCFVFMCKMKVSAQNKLLLSLGIFDLLSCCVGVPSELYDMRHYFLYQSVAACKTLRFLTIVPTLSSVLVLLVIAVERYRKICYPLHQQFEPRQIRLMILAIVAVSAVLSLPALFLYGHRSFPTGIPNLYGRDCSVNDNYKDGVFPLVYEALLAAAFAASIVVLISLYVRILIETRRHTRYMKKHAIVGGIHEEDRTISSVNISGQLKIDDADSSADESKEDKKKTSLLEYVLKRRKRRQNNQDMTSSDKEVDVLATEKMNSDLSSQDTCGNNIEDRDRFSSEKQPGVVRFNGQHFVINGDENDERDERQNAESDCHHCEDNQGENNDGVDTENEVISRPRCGTPIPSNLTATVSPTDSSGESTVNRDQHGKSRTINRDISITKQPLLQEGDSADAESSYRHYKKKSHRDARNKDSSTLHGHNSPRSPRNITSGNEDEILSHFDMACTHTVDIIRFDPDDEAVTYNLNYFKKPDLVCAKSVVSLNAVRVRKAVSSRRATVIAFVITFSFIVSYLPHLILIILRSVVTDFEHTLNEASLVFYNIFLRSYFANNVINVFVYGSMNIEFRMQLRKIWVNLQTSYRRR